MNRRDMLAAQSVIETMKTAIDVGVSLIELSDGIQQLQKGGFRDDQARGDNGRWIDEDRIKQAAGNKSEENKLRSEVSNPKELAKLNKQIEKAGGTKAGDAPKAQASGQFHVWEKDTTVPVATYKTKAEAIAHQKKGGNGEFEVGDDNELHSAKKKFYGDLGLSNAHVEDVNHYISTAKVKGKSGDMQYAIHDDDHDEGGWADMYAKKGDRGLTKIVNKNDKSTWIKSEDFDEPLPSRGKGNAAKSQNRVEAYGTKGLDNKKWRKEFKDYEELKDWAEQNQADVHGTREVETAPKVEATRDFVNLRTLATQGYHVEEGKYPYKVGDGVDFYDQKTGDKISGTLVARGEKTLTFKPDDGGPNQTFGRLTMRPTNNEQASQLPKLRDGVAVTGKDATGKDTNTASAKPAPKVEEPAKKVASPASEFVSAREVATRGYHIDHPGNPWKVGQSGDFYDKATGDKISGHVVKRGPGSITFKPDDGGPNQTFATLKTKPKSRQELDALPKVKDGLPVTGEAAKPETESPAAESPKMVPSEFRLATTEELSAKKAEPASSTAETPQATAMTKTAQKAATVLNNTKATRDKAKATVDSLVAKHGEDHPHVAIARQLHEKGNQLVKAVEDKDNAAYKTIRSEMTALNAQLKKKPAPTTGGAAKAAASPEQTPGSPEWKNAVSNQIAASSATGAEKAGMLQQVASTKPKSAKGVSGLGLKATNDGSIYTHHTPPDGKKLTADEVHEALLADGFTEKTHNSLGYKVPPRKLYERDGGPYRENTVEVHQKDGAVTHLTETNGKAINKPQSATSMVAQQRAAEHAAADAEVARLGQLRNVASQTGNVREYERLGRQIDKVNRERFAPTAPGGASDKHEANIKNAMGLQQLFVAEDKIRTDPNLSFDQKTKLIDSIDKRAKTIRTLRNTPGGLVTARERSLATQEQSSLAIAQEDLRRRMARSMSEQEIRDYFTSQGGDPAKTEERIQDVLRTKLTNPTASQGAQPAASQPAAGNSSSPPKNTDRGGALRAAHHEIVAAWNRPSSDGKYDNDHAGVNNAIKDLMKNGPQINKRGVLTPSRDYGNSGGLAGTFNKEQARAVKLDVSQGLSEYGYARSGTAKMMGGSETIETYTNPEHPAIVYKVHTRPVTEFGAKKEQIKVYVETASPRTMRQLGGK